MPGLRMVQVQTVPLAEEPDGSRRPVGLYERVDEEWTVGWCNVLVVEINGERHRMLHNFAAGG